MASTMKRGDAIIWTGPGWNAELRRNVPCTWPGTYVSRDPNVEGWHIIETSDVQRSVYGDDLELDHHA
jgi:hypothetical protein